MFMQKRDDTIGCRSKVKLKTAGCNQQTPGKRSLGKDRGAITGGRLEFNQRKTKRSRNKKEQQSKDGTHRLTANPHTASVFNDGDYHD